MNWFFRGKRGAKGCSPDAAAVITEKTALLLRSALAENKAKTELLGATCALLIGTHPDRETLLQEMHRVYDALATRSQDDFQYLAALDDFMQILTSAK